MLTMQPPCAPAPESQWLHRLTREHDQLLCGREFAAFECVFSRFRATQQTTLMTAQFQCIRITCKELCADLGSSKPSIW